MLQTQVASRQAKLTFPKSCIISAAVMSALRSNYWRRALLPVLLTASLLLPALHLHPVYEHDHNGHSHQYAIIHADFLSVSAQDHRHAQQKDFALGDSSPWSASQSSLSVVFTRGVESLLTGPEKGPDFLLVDVGVANARLVRLAHIIKRGHPPPLLQLFLAPNAPRSPPSFAQLPARF